MNTAEGTRTTCRDCGKIISDANAFKRHFWQYQKKMSLIATFVRENFTQSSCSRTTLDCSRQMWGWSDGGSPQSDLGWLWSLTNHQHPWLARNVLSRQRNVDIKIECMHHFYSLLCTPLGQCTPRLWLKRNHIKLWHLPLVFDPKETLSDYSTRGPDEGDYDKFLTMMYQRRMKDKNAKSSKSVDCLYVFVVFPSGHILLLPESPAWLTFFC